MQTLIRFLLSNFTLTFLILGLLTGGLAAWRSPRPRQPGAVVEAFFAHFLLLSIGLGFFYNFVMHAFFGEMAARFIGWADSPFQTELAFASLGFAVVGFLAFRGSRGLRVAAIVGPACFLWGAASVHVREMISAGNFAPGNAGVIFYTDLLLPLIGFLFLWLQAHPSEDTTRGLAGA